MNKDAARMPGAGAYSIPTRITEGPKIIIAQKTDKVDQNVKKGVPGPGQYNTQDSPGMVNRAAPAFSVGSGSRSDLANIKQSKFVPGPGNYSAAMIPKRNAPSFGFGK